MSTHSGAVRSFDLGGSRMGGRRWAARCSCGAVGTSGAWREALTFLTQHLEITARLRATWLTSHPSPDLRGEYWLPVVSSNGNGRTAPGSVVPVPVVRLLGVVARFVLGGLRLLAS